MPEASCGVMPSISVPAAGESGDKSEGRAEGIGEAAMLFLHESVLPLDLL